MDFVSPNTIRVKYRKGQYRSREGMEKIEELIRRFKEGCLIVNGELYESGKKVFCGPADGIRISINKDTLETRVVEDSTGLQRWDFLKDIRITDSPREKGFELEFDEVKPYGVAFEVRDGKLGIGWMTGGGSYEYPEQKLEHGIRREFRAKYVEMLKRGHRLRERG
jgi:hypothetical protein